MRIVPIEHDHPSGERADSEWIDEANPPTELTRIGFAHGQHRTGGKATLFAQHAAVETAGRALALVVCMTRGLSVLDSIRRLTFDPDIRVDVER